jgi:hypothetical protein
MKLNLQSLFSAFLVVQLSACASSAPVADNIQPSWINNPGNGVSASAGMNVRGRAAQEELATLRAREEFAKRFGVSINSMQSMDTSVTNGRTYTVGSDSANENSHQTDVRAVVKAKWLDQERDELWIWLVPVN